MENLKLFQELSLAEKQAEVINYITSNTASISVNELNNIGKNKEATGRE